MKRGKRLPSAGHNRRCERCGSRIGERDRFTGRADLGIFIAQVPGEAGLHPTEAVLLVRRLAVRTQGKLLVVTMLFIKVRIALRKSGSTNRTSDSAGDRSLLQHLEKVFSSDFSMLFTKAQS